MTYSFIDLFAGIGGFRYALEKYDCKCVFSSEIEKNAVSIYEKNFKDKPKGDIRHINVEDIPPHDILCGGFPCQSFSICGKKKGLNDTRGNLFYEIMRIVDYHKPKLILLENVKNISTMNDGKILKVIKDKLEESGYKLYYKVLNSVYFGVPQCRERTYFVAYLNSIDIEYEFPKNDILNLKCIKDILDPEEMVNTKLIINKENFSITNSKPRYVKPYKPCKIQNIGKGRQGERIYSINYPGITICSSSGGIGSKTGLYKVNDKIRKLTVNECRKMFSFPDTFEYDGKSCLTLQSKFGNAVVVNVISSIFDEILKLNIM